MPRSPGALAHWLAALVLLGCSEATSPPSFRGLTALRRGGASSRLQHESERQAGREDQVLEEEEEHQEQQQPLPGLLCRANAPCDLDGSSFRNPRSLQERFAVFGGSRRVMLAQELGRAQGALRAHLQAKAKAGGAPRIIHIGPSELRKPEEVSYYRQLLAMIPGLYQAVFVEPNVVVIPTLQGSLLGDIGMDKHLVQIIKRAVCPTSGSNVEFFRVSTRVHQDFPEIARAYPFHHVGALDREHTLEALEEAKLPLSYLENVTVPCVTPADLLSLVKVAPKDVDVITIDAEGHDLELTRYFLDLPKFSPASITFEWCCNLNNTEQELKAYAHLTKTLAARGYDVYIHENDVKALKPAPTAL